jgi:hypothetical protein
MDLLGSIWIVCSYGIIWIINVADLLPRYEDHIKQAY